MIYVVEIACIVFLLANAAICITFGSFQWQEWKAYRLYRAGFYACIGWLFGLYHLLFAILKAVYTALDALQ